MNAYPRRGEGPVRKPTTPSVDLRAVLAKNVSALAGETPSTGGLPTTASGPVWLDPSRHSDTDTNWGVFPDE